MTLEYRTDACHAKIQQIYNVLTTTCPTRRKKNLNESDSSKTLEAHGSTIKREIINSCCVEPLTLPCPLSFLKHSVHTDTENYIEAHGSTPSQQICLMCQ